MTHITWVAAESEAGAAAACWPHCTKQAWCVSLGTFLFVVLHLLLKILLSLAEFSIPICILLGIHFLAKMDNQDKENKRSNYYSSCHPKAKQDQFPVFYRKSHIVSFSVKEKGLRCPKEKQVSPRARGATCERLGSSSRPCPVGSRMIRVILPSGVWFVHHLQQNSLGLW